MIIYKLIIAKLIYIKYSKKKYVSFPLNDGKKTISSLKGTKRKRVLILSRLRLQRFDFVTFTPFFLYLIINFLKIKKIFL